MDVEQVRLDARQAIGYGDEFLAERRQLLQPFIQAEISEPVDADLDPKERAELLVGARHEALAECGQVNDVAKSAIRAVMLVVSCYLLAT